MIRRRREIDFSAEIQAHIALEADRLEREGLSRADAEAAARRAFGNSTAALERFHERGRWQWWDEIGKDAHYALRALAHSPAFTASAVVTLALGIGANTAIFSIIDAALLRPLPYPHPERIAIVYSGGRASGGNFSLAPATFLDFRAQSQVFETMAAFTQPAFNLTGGDRPERIEGAVVTPDFFAVLGVQAQFGRTLNAPLDRPGGARTVVLSYSLWQRRYGRNADLVGQLISVNGEPRTVVGVMPPSFRYPSATEAWTPARYLIPEHPLRPDFDQTGVRDAHYFNTIGRLRPGVLLAQAQAEAGAIAGRLKQQYIDEESGKATIVSLRDDLVGEARPALLVLLGAVGLLLAIACANVANLLLARGATREKEMAIRGALGAGRARLTRQLLTESALLAITGGGFGILLAYASLAPLRALVPADLTGGATFHLDIRILMFTAAIAAGSALLFGLYPARQAAGFGLNGVLKEGGRGSAGSRSRRVRNVLAVSEIALAAVLLIGAGLLIRSFDRLLQVPGGFHPDRVLTLKLSLPPARYPRAGSRARFVAATVERIGALPGVASAAAISRLPLNAGNSTRSVDIKGRTLAPDEIAPDYLVVTPDYFRVLGIRVKHGRTFTGRDDANAAPVVIVNDAMARHFWPGQDPVGQNVQVGGCGGEKDWCQVVGVVEDVRQHNLDQAVRPAVYVPYARDPWPFMVFVVRTQTDPSVAVSAVSDAIHAVDKEQPVYSVRTMEQVVSESLTPRRTRTLLVGLFASLALTLACLGVYGVIAYSVAQRAREIGIRIALGAGRREVISLITGHALRLSLAGIFTGILLALGLTRYLSNLLYGVGPGDPATFLSVSVLLVATTLAASYVPARRAIRTDPLASLRSQ